LFKPVIYWDAFELSYQLYEERFAGRGYATEAVQLMVDYLFAVKKQDRIQLDIAPENAASRRIAESGFTLEGTARGAMFNRGRNQDLLIYSLLRSDPRPWLAAWATNRLPLAARVGLSGGWRIGDAPGDLHVQGVHAVADRFRWWPPPQVQCFGRYSTWPTLSSSAHRHRTRGAGRLVLPRVWWCAAGYRLWYVINGRDDLSG
jgi:hypothetical protein